MIDQLPARSSGMPERIGPYRVVGRLGKGAMGIVYRARDEQLMRDVAVKLLMTDVEDEPETRTRFFREAQITSKLLHRNIVTVLDVGEDDGRLFIVMELLKGETLTEFMKRPVPPILEQQIDLMIQTCEGLAVAHAKGIVHRDIKPGNLFVLTDGSLKILDFGVAHLASSTMTASGLILGTPDYMSPEQARGQQIDGRSDIFSTAAVFYLMLTGRKPFDGPNLPAVLQRVMREEPLPIREHEAPSALARIISKALEKDVSDRYQRFADMVVDLVRFKRQFDNETRQLVSAARQSFDEARRRAAEVNELRAALLMPPAANVAEPADLERRFPFFCAGSDGTPPVSGLTGRHRVTSVITELQVAQEPIADELTRLRAALQEADRAEKALLARNPKVALDHLDRASRSVGTNSERLVDGKARAEQQLGELQTQERRVRVLLEEARSAASRLEWTVVAERCSEVLDIRPGEVEATALAKRAQSAHAVERRRLSVQADRVEAEETRRAQLTRHENEARAYLEKDDPAAALRSSQMALSIDSTLASALHIQKLASERLRQRAELAAKSSEAAQHVARGAEYLAAGRLQKAARQAQIALTLDSGRSDAVMILEESQRLEAEAREKRGSEIKKREDRTEFAAIAKSVRRAIRARDFQRAVWLAENAVMAGDHGRAAEELLAEAKQASAVSAGGDRQNRDGSSSGRDAIADPDDTVILAARRPSVVGFMAGMAERVRRWRRKRGSSRLGH